jgi:hypothetical protein
MIASGEFIVWAVCRQTFWGRGLPRPLVQPPAVEVELLPFGLNDAVAHDEPPLAQDNPFFDRAEAFSVVNSPGTSLRHRTQRHR